MDAALLIDSIVRQTTVLIAQLATSAGTRAPLAHTANQVFLNLVAELKQQGLGNKVIADMFGLALRTYHGKVQRLSESSTFRGRSLWTAVLEFIQAKETITRSELFQRFHYDDEATVKSVLKDLVDTGLLLATGRGPGTVYRAASLKDSAPDADMEAERLAHFVWVAVHGFGPLTAEEIADHVSTEKPLLAAALVRLVNEGKVVKEEAGDATRYHSEHCLIPVGSETGWEASVFDHYQALVSTICAKLVRGNPKSVPGEDFGGSTYHFDVWPGHPHFAEVKGHLSALRAQSVNLRERVEAYNQSHSTPPEDEVRRFIAYVGQSLRVAEEERK